MIPAARGKKSSSGVVAAACAALVVVSLPGGCDPGGDDGDDGDDGDGGDSEGACEPWATALVAFDPGDGAGYGADGLPGVVLGPPDGGKATQGALDVVSLGLGGAITLELGCPINDGDGPDLFVYENPFAIAGGPRVFADPAEVAVSVDGATWATFPCVPPPSSVADDDGPGGCAGMTPVSANGDNALTGTVQGGGDAFDLASLAGVVDSSDGAAVSGGVRFVRITDRSTGGAEPNAGFDLDAVAGAVGRSVR
jgi:hypothetical protein